jgi:hypothetical protein
MKLNHCLVPVLLCGAAVSVAEASMVDVFCPGVGAGRNVTVTQGSTNYNVFAGQIRLVLSNSTGQPFDTNWFSFCTELAQNIHINGPVRTYQVSAVSDLPTPGTGMGTARADALARMYFSASGAQFGTNADYAAAFQIAVWEIVNDFDGTVASLDLSTGSFRGTIGAAISANFASLFAAASNTGGNMNALLGLGNTSFQDQIIDVTNGIPTPGAMALLALAGFTGLRRRR